MLNSVETRRSALENSDVLNFFDACKQGKKELVEKLIERGVDVHAEDDQALVYASLYDHADVVEVLLKHGANVHASDDAALRLASMFGYAEVAELLLGYGADLSALNFEGSLLKIAFDDSHIKIIKKYPSENEGDIHNLDYDCLLKVAAYYGNPKVILSLLARKDIHDLDA